MERKGRPTLRLIQGGLSDEHPLPEPKIAKGQLIQHRLFGYRGVVVGVDLEFCLSDEWYEEIAKSRPPKNRPWYHVLVDDSEAATYVAERNLELASDRRPVSHPLIRHYFEKFSKDRYIPLASPDTHTS